MTDGGWRIAEGNSPRVTAFSSLGPWSAKHTPQGSAFALPRLRLTLSTVAAATSGSAFQFSVCQLFPSAIRHLPSAIKR